MTESAHFQLRRAILSVLYEHFRSHPYAPMDMHLLAEACRVEATELNWNLVYLEKSGLIELGTLEELPPFIACSAAISAEGINLIEDAGAWKEKFPVPEN